MKSCSLAIAWQTALALRHPLSLWWIPWIFSVRAVIRLPAETVWEERSVLWTTGQLRSNQNRNNQETGHGFKCCTMPDPWVGSKFAQLSITANVGLPYTLCFGSDQWWPFKYWSSQWWFFNMGAPFARVIQLHCEFYSLCKAVEW